MSTFNPEAMMDTQIEESMSTESIPVPEADAAPGYVAEKGVKLNQYTNQEKGTVTTICNVNWVIDTDEAREVTGRERPIAQQTIFLDLDENGYLDTSKGANVALGRLRDALGLNEPGQPFTFRMLEGKQAKLRIKHEIRNIGGMDVTVASVRGVLPIDAEV